MIEGLELILDFISEAEEKAILDEVPLSAPSAETFRNKIRRYGPQTAYRNNVVSNELPKTLALLCPRLGLDYVPTSITVNDYHEGQSIIPHIDDRSCGPVISVLSLISEATMKFTKDGISHYVKLPPRSLVHMRGEVRYKWQHSVEPLKGPRMSVVFRK